MKKSYRQAAAVVLLITLLASMLTVFAVEPRYTYIRNLSCEVNVVDGKVIASASLQGTSDVTKCQIALTIQKKVGTTWEDVITWTTSKDSNSMTMERSTASVAGTTYRAKATGKVWFAGGTESDTTTGN